MRFLVLLFGIIIALPTMTFAQEVFQGKITYTIELEGDKNRLKAMKAVNPNEMILNYLDEKLRIEFSYGDGQAPRQVILIDGAKKELYNIDHSDHTITLFSDVEPDYTEVKRSIHPEEEVVEILGYDCRKHTFIETVDGETTTTYYWITSELLPKNRNLSHSSIKRLDSEAIEGLILKEAIQFEIDGKSYTQTTTAIEMEQEKPAPSLFNWQILDYMIMDDRMDEE